MIRALILCCVFAILGLSAQTARATNAPIILEKYPCYPQFATYEQWMDFLWEKNNLLAYAVLRLRYSKTKFNRFKHELDCTEINYSSDEHVVYGFVVMPKQRPAGRKLPVIIFNRGGNGMLGALTLATLLDHISPLAEQGYVVMASQYRGVPPLAKELRSPDQFGGDDVRDVTNLIGLVKQIPAADPNNVFMLGQSRGAIMTFRALPDSPLPIRAIAIHSGVFDLQDLLTFRPEFEGLFQARIPGYAANRKVELARRSVTQWPERLPATTAILIVHGDEDERAPLISAKNFAAQLKRLGRKHQLVVLSGESHSLDGAREEVRERTIAWFRRSEQPPQAAAAKNR